MRLVSIGSESSRNCEYECCWRPRMRKGTVVATGLVDLPRGCRCTDAGVQIAAPLLLPIGLLSGSLLLLLVSYCRG